MNKSYAVGLATVLVTVVAILFAVSYFVKPSDDSETEDQKDSVENTTGDQTLPADGITYSFNFTTANNNEYTVSFVSSDNNIVKKTFTAASPNESGGVSFGSSAFTMSIFEQTETGSQTFDKVFVDDFDGQSENQIKLVGSNEQFGTIYAYLETGIVYVSDLSLNQSCTYVGTTLTPPCGMPALSDEANNIVVTVKAGGIGNSASTDEIIKTLKVEKK